MEDDAWWCGFFWVFIRTSLKLLGGSEAREFLGIFYLFVCVVMPAQPAGF